MANGFWSRNPRGLIGGFNQEDMRNVPPGLLSAALGIPGDANEMARSGLGLMAKQPITGPMFGLLAAPREQTTMGTTEDFGNLMGADTSTAGFQAATMVSPDPMGPVAKIGKGIGLLSAGITGITKAGKKGAKKSAKEAADDAARQIETITRQPKITAKSFSSPGSGVRAKDTFMQRLSEARQKMPPEDAAQVDPRLPDNFNGQVFLTDDGHAGFALSKDGYVSHLFKDPDAPFAGTIGAAMTKARAAGAKNLDAFDTYLVRNYTRTGAIETGRVPFSFDPEVASQEVIDALGPKAPDYVSMNVGGVIPTQKHSLILGPRVQQELQRFHAARGEPAAVADYFRGGRTPRLNRLTQEGVKQDGHKWYWLGGMLDRFIGEFGAEEGVKRFDRFMELNGALSPRSTVSKNIQRASILYQKEVNGVPFEKMFQPPGSQANPKGLLQPTWPEGYGHLANDIHMDNVERLLRDGYFNPVDQPKIAAYIENLKGNYRPIAIDTHNNLVVTGKRNAKGEPIGPTEAQYPHLERRQQELAGRMGLDPAEWQSALWVGAGDITGVDDVRNFPDAMNVRIAKTAEVLDIPEEEAFVRFMTGDTQLYSVMAALIGAGVLAGAAGAGREGRPET